MHPVPTPHALQRRLEPRAFGARPLHKILDAALFQDSQYDIFICPISIAYRMGQIIKPVCARASVCPSVRTLTVAFLVPFLLKLAPT